MLTFLRVFQHRTLLLPSKPIHPRPALHRAYASKSKTKSTLNLKPHSQQPITEPDALAEFNKTSEKMSNAVEWFRRECAALETRASGRVTPAILDPVKVAIPDMGDERLRLNDVATVGVREGTTLIVTVFDDNNTKYIEQALYDAKIPSVVPQRIDPRTIKIPIPKPTVEARTSLYTNAAKQAEDTRAQLRKLHSASLKRGQWEKYSVETEEFQKLTTKSISDIDNILVKLKESTDPNMGGKKKK